MQKTIVFILCLLAGLAVAQEEQRLTAGFIYVGPVGDYGWTYAHDLGRQAAEEALPWLDTIIVESVPEAEVEAFIDQLVRQGADVIFTTSFGYGDGTLAAAERYPDIVFAHATGEERAPNVATYTAEFYQAYYLNGLIAGALTESNTLGYVAAFPIPEVKRHINAFALGANEVNPDATVNVQWLGAWFDPAGATENTQLLLSQGADVFAFTEDTPTVIQVAAQQGYPSYSHYASMLEFSPDTVVSGQLVNWEVIYIDFLSKVYEGEYTPENLEDVDYFDLLDTGAVEVGAEPGMVINPAYEDRLREAVIDHPEFGSISVYDLVLERLEQMSQPEPAFDPFEGPISDRNGVERVAEGERPDVLELISMQWAAPNVVGAWDGEPSE